MTAVIYYFSGTGNSLYVAREAAKRLGDCRVVNMATLAAQQEVTVEGEVVGLVFPVYYYSVPAFVEAFVRRLRFTGQPYVFGIATCGGGPGNTLFRLQKLLKGRGATLAAGFTLDMPSNAYVGFSLLTPPAQRDELVRSADQKLSVILEAIAKKGRPGIEGRYQLIPVIGAPLMQIGTSKGYRLWTRYYTTDQCNGCGICQRICPTGNISVVDKKVSWGSHCAECLACFHWCPQQAVQQNSRTPKVSRYHHPAVTLKEMLIR